jgi:taurine dioxygenase
MAVVGRLEPLSGALGAEVLGVDVTTVDRDWLRTALLEHQVLAIRDQALSPAGLSAFAATLGEREVYPFSGAVAEDPYVAPIVHEPDDEEVFGGIWHTDSSYLERPPSLTLLYAVEVPARGGDTVYANMYAVYDGLSEGLKRALEGLSGIFSADLVHSVDGEHAAAAGADRNRRIPERPLVAEHPIVRTHPETGRKAIYASLAHTREFKDFTRAESLPLLEYLSAQTRKYARG